MTEATTQMALTERPAEMQAVTPASLVQLAMSGAVDPDKLQKLMDFAERYQANQAKMAYNASMAEFKQHPPRISKNRHVKFGTTEYDHATLDNVVDQITAALSKVGISHKWDTEQRDGKIIVTCVLTHRMGHSERTPLEATADTSGSKNAIQAIGSAVTYLQRYTLLAATGLAVAGADNDGKGAEPAMEEKAYIAHLDNIQNAGNVDELKRVFGVAYKEAQEVGDNAARDAFIKAKDNRRKELTK